MAFFSKKPNTKETVPAAAEKAPVVPAKAAKAPRIRAATHALIAPRITEKGAYLGESGCYIFNVREGSNKREIAIAIKAAFGVEPRMVRVARITRKKRQTRGTNRTGMTAGGKKAYVYLKRGDKIELA